jgi:hypothetical protein
MPETEWKIPYAFDETLRTGYECKGEHTSRHVKYEGPLWIEICLDPKCAKVFATCEHQVVVEGLDPMAPTKPINKWNEDGSVLTCQYCGADVT